MKLIQQREFKPITLVLETKEEAEMFWDIVRTTDTGHDSIKKLKCSGKYLTGLPLVLNYEHGAGHD